MRFDDWNNDELYHHGIKGQKWGIRRYQNPDGSLTKAGQARYGGQPTYDKGNSGFENAVRNILTNRAAFGKYKGKSGGDIREERLQRRVQKLTERSKDITQNDKKKQKIENKLEKTKNKLQAQKDFNLNAKAYEKHTDTGKLFAQEALLGPLAAQLYRNARAGGADRGRAFAESLWGDLPITSTVLRATRNKKTYGRAFVHSAINE